jgi:hypothetical protein
VNKVFNIIDKYKFGILAAFATYIGIFMYLQMKTYSQYFPVVPFSDVSEVVIEEKLIEVTPENIEILKNQNAGKAKNIARDKNDTRKRSDENWTQNKSASQVEQSVKDYEKKLFQEAGGDAKRQSIKKEMDARNNQKTTTNSGSKEKSSSNQNGGNTAFSGNVMVDWSLSGRNPHQNNNWYVRNPGYTCGYGSSGRVSVKIKVNQNGDVIEAIPTGSAGSNSCMIEQAVKYAKLSRFNYSGTAAKTQEGTIIYTFEAQ